MKFQKTFAIVSILTLFAPNLAFAFDYGNLISNETMLDSGTMNRADIQHFLESNGSVLADYYTTDDDGKRRSAASIIYRASRDYLINPQVILTKIQQESSLITRSTATDRQLSRILGYGIPDGGVANPAYAGFFNQVDGATWQFNRYMREPKSYDKQVGVEVIDGSAIEIDNLATASLYTYTPHKQGAKLFRSLWDRWFSRLLLSGTLVEDEHGNYYLIRGTTKRLIANETVLNLNFDVRKKIHVPSAELTTYSNGPKITLPTNFFFRASWGTVYYIDVDDDGDAIRRGVSSQQVLRDLGVSPELVFPATSSDLLSIPEGPAITPDDYENRDKLLQAPEGGVIYLGRDGKGHSLYGRAVMEANFPGWKPEPASQATIDELKRGDPVYFPEGTLITRKDVSGPVYVIVRNEETNVLEKRPFKEASIFEDMGYNWSNILQVSKKELNLHPRGAQIKTSTL